jgi:hypothetical protein
VTTKLTKAIIAAAAPQSKDLLLWDSEVRGLHIRIAPSGRKTFAYQYRFNRRSRKLTLVLPRCCR